MQIGSPGAPHDRELVCRLQPGQADLSAPDPKDPAAEHGLPRPGVLNRRGSAQQGGEGGEASCALTAGTATTKPLGSGDAEDRHLPEAWQPSPPLEKRTRAHRPASGAGRTNPPARASPAYRLPPVSAPDAASPGALNSPGCCDLTRVACVHRSATFSDKPFRWPRLTLTPTFFKSVFTYRRERVGAQQAESGPLLGGEPDPHPGILTRAEAEAPPTAPPAPHRRLHRSVSTAAPAPPPAPAGRTRR